jgi:hypothetical protein
MLAIRPLSDYRARGQEFRAAVQLRKFIRHDDHNNWNVVAVSNPCRLQFGGRTEYRKICDKML